MNRKELIESIIDLIKLKKRNLDTDTLLRMYDLLGKATTDDLERTYDAFNRFGVESILKVLIR